jgi:hypothetical protein
MENNSIQAADWRQRPAAKEAIEYPPCFRAKRTQIGGLKQPSQLRTSSALNILNSPSSCSIDPMWLVDANPSFTSSQRSAWSPTSESTRESMLLRRLKSFASSESSKFTAEDPDPFISLYLRHDSAKSLLHEKPGCTPINPHDQIVAPNYPVSIAFCKANGKGVDISVAQNDHVGEDCNIDEQHSGPIAGFDDVSMNFSPYGDFVPEETRTWMAEFFEDSQPGEETLLKEVPRFKVKTADDQEEQLQLKQKSHACSRDNEKRLKKENKEGTNPDNRDAYFIKMLNKFLSLNTGEDAVENSITLLPKCLRATSCFSGNPAPESTAVTTTSTKLMKMFDNIDCLKLDDERNSYRIVDAYVFERIHSLRSSSSTFYSSSTSFSLSTYTHESNLEKNSKDSRMDRHQCDVGDEVNTNSSTDVTDPCNGSSDTIPDCMVEYRSMGTNTDAAVHRLEYTPHDSMKKDAKTDNIHADQPSVRLPKGKKWHRKLVQARLKLLLRRHQHKSHFLYLPSASSSSSSSSSCC